MWHSFSQLKNCSIIRHCVTLQLSHNCHFFTNVTFILKITSNCNIISHVTLSQLPFSHKCTVAFILTITRNCNIISQQCDFISHNCHLLTNVIFIRTITNSHRNCNIISHCVILHLTTATFSQMWHPFSQLQEILMLYISVILHLTTATFSQMGLSFSMMRYCNLISYNVTVFIFIFLLLKIIFFLVWSGNKLSKWG